VWSIGQQRRIEYWLEVTVTTIRRFEELHCWKKSRQLANTVYDLCEQPKFTKDYALKNQIRSAAGSIMHNIAEGFSAGTNPEFIRFLKIARRSASEVQSQLYLALDRKYISSDDHRSTYELAEETKRLINGFIAYLRKSEYVASSHKTTP
jgi:four helix bundle protein